MSLLSRRRKGVTQFRMACTRCGRVLWLPAEDTGVLHSTCNGKGRFMPVREAEPKPAPKPESPGKCGNCLMEAVVIVALRPDGTCPRCGGNYAKGIAPKREQEIARPSISNGQVCPACWTDYIPCADCGKGKLCACDSSVAEHTCEEARK